LHDAFRLFAGFRNHEIEQVIVAADTREFRIRRISDFIGVQPRNHILKEQALHHWLGEVKEIIQSKHGLDKTVFFQRKVFGGRMHL